MSVQLTSLVVIGQVAGKSSEWAVPKAKAWLRTWWEERGMRRRGMAAEAMTVHEENAKLEPHEGVFSEYNKLIIQLGYVVLFAPACPIASLICYVGNLLEIRTDAYKVASPPCNRHVTAM